MSKQYDEYPILDTSLSNEENYKFYAKYPFLWVSQLNDIIESIPEDTKRPVGKILQLLESLFSTCSELDIDLQFGDVAVFKFAKALVDTIHNDFEDDEILRVLKEIKLRRAQRLLDVQRKSALWTFGTLAAALPALIYRKKLLGNITNDVVNMGFAEPVLTGTLMIASALTARNVLDLLINKSTEE